MFFGIILMIYLNAKLREKRVVFKWFLMCESIITIKNGGFFPNYFVFYCCEKHAVEGLKDGGISMQMFLSTFL